jgi:hypothetical protein
LTPAFAGPPRVEFDVSTVIACREVTTPDFAAVHSQERLFEATIQISSLLRGGQESDLIQYFYRIESPEGTVRIVDHLPRTEVTSPIIGKIAVEKKDESGCKVNGVFGGQYPPFGQAELQAHAGASSGLSLRYEMLPRKELLAASGTLHRERGVYFKLKPSPQTSLEGAKQFVCVVCVPNTWRGDYVRVECQASGYNRRGWHALDTSASCGHAAFLVGLYVAGDEEARQVVAQAVAHDELLTSLVRRHGPKLAAALSPSNVPGYVELRRLVRPLEHVELRRSLLESVAQDAAAADVPTDIRAAAADFQQSLRAVTALNREGTERKTAQSLAPKPQLGEQAP